MTLRLPPSPGAIQFMGLRKETPVTLASLVPSPEASEGDGSFARATGEPLQLFPKFPILCLHTICTPIRIPIRPNVALVQRFAEKGKKRSF